jgi:hypothetical protein
LPPRRLQLLRRLLLALQEEPNLSLQWQQALRRAQYLRRLEARLLKQQRQRPSLHTTREAAIRMLWPLLRQLQARLWRRPGAKPAVQQQLLLLL